MGFAIFMFLIIMITMVCAFIGIHMMFTPSHEKNRFWNGMALAVIPMLIFALLLFLMILPTLT